MLGEGEFVEVPLTDEERALVESFEYEVEGGHASRRVKGKLTSITKDGDSWAFYNDDVGCGFSSSLDRLINFFELSWEEQNKAACAHFEKLGAMGVPMFI